MAKLKRISFRASDEWKTEVLECAARLGMGRGDKDKGVSDFIRNACRVMVNKVLGKRPTLPIYRLDKKH